MKILYAIQGTGNGHITVALEVLPYLMKKGEVDILLSGTEVDVTLPYEIKYRLNGLCFVFGKKGGIDYLETYKKARLKGLFREIKALPVEEYDLIISDFEPVSAWACYLKNKACTGFSHQVAVADKQSPKPKKTDLIGQAVLKYYAPVSARCGFHFSPYNKNIFTPIIRRAIREAEVTGGDHITVYLPAYNDKRLIKLLACFPEQQWQVFSKRCREAYSIGSIHIYPVTNKAFARSMVSARGVFCGAGFQTPAEALFLQKKLLVIPMKGQYEQQCNAVALAQMGVPFLKNVKAKQYEKLRDWLQAEDVVPVNFPNDTEWIVAGVLEQAMEQKQELKRNTQHLTTPASFRRVVVKKIFQQLGS